MLALTLWQPWCQFMADGFKPIENRDWEFPEYLVGKSIALHAGKHFDKAAVAWIRERFPELRHPDAYVSGAVVAVVRVASVIRRRESEELFDPLAEAIKARQVTPDEARWYMGQRSGVVCRDLRKLPIPIACRGDRKLWKLKPEIEAKVLAQLGGVP